ncbi:MAG: DsbE family thiol:disulfide interchange protein [Alphaproteobacteria bacterium]|nr:DsbE family thiol:disulfide interchange protein [Alphaproteobacteria bacterium]
MRRLLYLLPLAAFTAIALWFAIGLTRDPSRVPSALLDRPVPEFALPALAGAGVAALSSGDLRSKVALVNVFASWCVPCRVEHPILMRLARESGLTLYGISYKDKAEDSARFLRELGNPYAAIGHDESGRVGIEWGVYGVPETFVIDRTGHIRHKHVGPISPKDLQETILPLIASLSR